MDYIGVKIAFGGEDKTIAERCMVQHAEMRQKRKL